MLGQEEHAQNGFSYEIPDGESVTQAVVNAVSAVSSTPSVPTLASEDAPDPLAPLYTAIDPDALDSLFSPENAPEGARLEFRYHGYEITVHGGDSLSLSEL